MILIIFLMSTIYANEFSLKTFFNQIYVINLDHRTDRLSNVDHQLGVLGLTYTRFSAVNGKLVRDKLLQGAAVTKNDLGWPEAIKFDLQAMLSETFVSQHESNIIWSQIGCWQSHLQVFYKIIKETIAKGMDGPILILEDDVEIDADMEKYMKKMMTDIPDDWEIFAIGNHHSICQEIVSSEICLAYSFVGTDAYIFRNSAVAQKFFDLANTIERQVIDMFWIPFMQTRQIKFYIAYPYAIIQQDIRRFDSDIMPIFPGRTPSRIVNSAVSKIADC